MGDVSTPNATICWSILFILAGFLRQDKRLKTQLVADMLTLVGLGNSDSLLRWIAKDGWECIQKWCDSGCNRISNCSCFWELLKRLIPSVSCTYRTSEMSMMSGRWTDSGCSMTFKHTSDIYIYLMYYIDNSNCNVQVYYTCNRLTSLWIPTYRNKIYIYNVPFVMSIFSCLSLAMTLKS